MAAAIREVSRAVSKPTLDAIDACDRILQYVKGTADWGLEFHIDKKWDSMGHNERFLFYVDSDYAGDIPGRLSTTGMLVTYCNFPIFWKSTTQKCV